MQIEENFPPPRRRRHVQFAIQPLLDALAGNREQRRLQHNEIAVGRKAGEPRTKRISLRDIDYKLPRITMYEVCAPEVGAGLEGINIEPSRITLGRSSHGWHHLRLCCAQQREREEDGNDFFHWWPDVRPAAGCGFAAVFWVLLSVLAAGLVSGPEAGLDLLSLPDGLDAAESFLAASLYFSLR